MLAGDVDHCQLLLGRSSVDVGRKDFDLQNLDLDPINFPVYIGPSKNMYKNPHRAFPTTTFQSHTPQNLPTHTHTDHNH